MKAGWMAEASPLVKFLMVFVVVITSAVVVTTLFLLAAIPFFGLHQVVAITTGTASLKMIKFVQIVQSVSVFIFPSLLAAYLLSQKPLKWLKFWPIDFKNSAAVIFIVLASQPLVGWLGYLNMQMELPDFLHGWERWMATAEENADGLIYRFLNTTSVTAILTNVLMIAVLPALGEELLFRGAIQTTLKNMTNNAHSAIWMTAFLFSAMHLQFFTFLPRFFLGALLGYLLVYGKSIWYPIIGHFINNLLSLILFYYLRATEPNLNPLDASTDRPDVWMILASTALLIGLFGLFRKNMSWAIMPASTKSK